MARAVDFWICREAFASAEDEKARTNKLGPLNQGGNPRYRLDDVFLVTDLLPLMLGLSLGVSVGQ